MDGRVVCARQLAGKHGPTKSTRCIKGNALRIQRWVGNEKKME